MLMYALYITFEWSFDFTQNDMPYIRECWLNLILKCMCHKREASRSIKWTTCIVVPRTMGFLRVSSNCTFLEILTRHTGVCIPCTGSMWFLYDLDFTCLDHPVSYFTMKTDGLLSFELLLFFFFYPLKSEKNVLCT